MELVASVRKHTGREFITGWLHDLPTKYTVKQLRNILTSHNHGKLLLWSLEDVYSRKGEELVEKGVTIL